jgi:HK97 family phage major capsid protein
MPKVIEQEPKTKQKKKDKALWLKLAEPFQGHAAGEVIKVPKKEAKDLIEQQKALEAESPERKLMNKAVKKLLKGLGQQMGDSTKEALDDILKAKDAAQEAYANRVKNLLGVNSAQAGRLVDRGMSGHFVKGADDALVYRGEYYSSGIGMGKFLKQAIEYAYHPSKDLEAQIAKDWNHGQLSDDTKDLGGLLVSKTPLAEGAGTTGGFLVPTEFYMQLQQIAGQNAVVRPRARIIPMGARSVHIPTLDVTTNYGAGVSPFYAGVVGQWVEEAQTRPEFEPQFKQVELIAHELSLLSKSSMTLLADNAVTLDAVITTLFGKALGFYEDYAFIQGTGAGKPLGILNAPASIVVNRSVANSFKLVDAAVMLSKLLISSMGSAVWIMSQTLIPQLVQLADAAGRVVWIPNQQSMGGAAQSLPVTLFGLPIIFTEKVGALGGKGDVMLADFQYYLIGDRQNVQIDTSMHAFFGTNQFAWRCIKRVDGQPWLDNAITLADGSTTVSPFVILQ